MCVVRRGCSKVCRSNVPFKFERGGARLGRGGAWLATHPNDRNRGIPPKKGTVCPSVSAGRRSTYWWVIIGTVEIFWNDGWTADKSWVQNLSTTHFFVDKNVGHQWQTVELGVGVISYLHKDWAYLGTLASISETFFVDKFFAKKCRSRHIV